MLFHVDFKMLLSTELGYRRCVAGFNPCIAFFWVESSSAGGEGALKTWVKRGLPLDGFDLYICGNNIVQGLVNGQIG